MTDTPLQHLADILTTDGVLIHPATGDIGLHSAFVEANETACRLLGHSREELLTLTLSDLTEFSPIPLEALDSLRKGGRVQFRHTLLTESNRETPVEFTMRLAVITDIPMVVTLIRDAGERTHMERELGEARRAVKSAGEFKSQFLANMSHELRTPLNGIMGMTQILMNTDLSPDQQEYLTLSLQAARHLNKAVADLLALSGIQSDGMDITPTDFNLHDTLHAIVKPLALRAANKSLRLKLAISDDVPAEVNGDSGKLRQILINLLLNAIKFTEDGTISLTVNRTTSTPDDTPDAMAEISFTVSDTGIGIPPEKQESIFESFSLAEDYMTKQYGGTGLGLSISSKLADILDGSISLESTPGKGSVFTLILPLLVRQSQVRDTTDNKPIPAVSGPLKILLAEDEQVNSIMASRLLKNAGHTVTIAGNGQQALDLLSNNRYDLVLMDVQMPVLNGLQATEIIRSGAAENIPRDLPVIGLTAYARKEERQRFVEAGMQHIVTKPYEADELLQAIAKAMVL